MEGRALSRPWPTGTPQWASLQILKMIDEPSGRKHPIHQPVHERGDIPIIIFLTVCSKLRKRIFANPEAYDCLRDAWRQTKYWLVGRYMIMPDHIHLFCAPEVQVPQSLEAWLAFWKSSAARHWPHREDAPIWQRHCWDTQLRPGNSYDAKWDYVVENPSGQDWSSAPKIGPTKAR